MTQNKFQLTNVATGKTTELPTLSGTIGPDVVNISSLYKDHGVFTFDPGFMATASTESRVTYIDGDQGVLMYPGYQIEQLAAKSSHLEVAYLLINGELPTAAEFDVFSDSIRHHTMMNESLLKMYNGFHHDAHPMAMTAAIVASMGAFYHDGLNIDDPRSRQIFAERIIAKILTFWAAA